MKIKCCQSTPPLCYEGVSTALAVQLFHFFVFSFFLFFFVCTWPHAKPLSFDVIARKKLNKMIICHAVDIATHTCA